MLYSSQKKIRFLRAFYFTIFNKSSEKRLVWTHPELLVGSAPSLCFWRQARCPFCVAIFLPTEVSR